MRPFGYEVRGLPGLLTSHDDPDVGSAAVVNEVKLVYNHFAQAVEDRQSHDGAVTMSTPKVQYGYADGSANTTRRTSITYPNGRTLTIGYGASGVANDAASRVEALIDSDPDATHLAEYEYLGLSSPVVVDYTEPDLKFTLVGTQGGTDPVAAANNARFDELYAYDGLQRLKEMQRGTLDAQILSERQHVSKV